MRISPAKFLDEQTRRLQALGIVQAGISEPSPMLHNGRGGRRLGAGRKKRHESVALKQRAYRDRKRKRV
jgi:hypothetical protein